MNFLINQIREQKFLEMEVSLDDFISENNISEKSIIFELELSKEFYPSEKEVREYLKDKYYSPIKISDEGDSFIVSVVSENQVDSETEITVKIRKGVIGKAADLLPVTVTEELYFNDKGELNLSSKFDSIDLSVNAPQIIEIARVAEGDHPSYGKLKITQEHLETMVSNFKSKVTGVDLSVNEDHKKNEAFGWFKDVFLSFDKQTLYGQIVWNSKGTTALSEKEYRYFSPEFRFNYKHPHSGEEFGATLLGGALTNYPFLKMEAIVELNEKQEQQKEGVQMKTIELSVHESKVVELSNKITETQTKLDATEAQNVELSEKVKALEEKIEKEAKEKAHEKLFNEGKINKAQLVALNEGKTFLEVLSLNEKMNVDEKGTSGKKVETVELSEKQKKIIEQLGLTTEEYLAIEK